MYYDEIYEKLIFSDMEIPIHITEDAPIEMQEAIENFVNEIPLEYQNAIDPVTQRKPRIEKKLDDAYETLRLYDPSAYAILCANGVIDVFNDHARKPFNSHTFDEIEKKRINNFKNKLVSLGVPKNATADIVEVLTSL